MPRYIPQLGHTKFIEHEDTPNSYVGQSGKVVAVKTSEDALEFIALKSLKTARGSLNFTGTGTYTFTTGFKPLLIFLFTSVEGTSGEGSCCFGSATDPDHQCCSFFTSIGVAGGESTKLIRNTDMSGTTTFLQGVLTAILSDGFQITITTYVGINRNSCVWVAIGFE